MYLLPIPILTVLIENRTHDLLYYLYNLMATVWVSVLVWVLWTTNNRPIQADFSSKKAEHKIGWVQWLSNVFRF